VNPCCSQRSKSIESSEEVNRGSRAEFLRGKVLPSDAEEVSKGAGVEEEHRGSLVCAEQG